MRVLYFIILITVITLVNTNPTNAQVTGLSGWNIFVDPGHSQMENMGIYNYSEAQKVLRVGLNLRELLLETTDIDTVYMSRTNDQQQVSLTQRTDHANSVGAAWYHSIHSNAGAPSTNNTLLLWGQYQNGQEKIPNGGKAMSNIMIVLLTAGYRIPTIGSIGDCTFYGCTFTGPYLHVNRETNMPSELSEAGFHTNPTQNQRNMNAKWKRLEAYTFYWTILNYHQITRPFVGITTGIISNIEGGQPINGAIVSINGQVDTTDTYESLFNLYSTDPGQLRNGFYFFEDLPAGTHQITVEAEGFEPYSGDIIIQDTFFTFKDVQLVSNVPPYIVQTSPEQNDSLYPGVENIGIIFSRPMDRASVESTLTISPPESVSFAWSNGDRQMAITTANFDFNTNYQLTISGNAMDKYGHPFDGDGNGVGGDDFILNFKTKIEDMIPPAVINFYPPDSEADVELNPIINLSFNERINTSTLSGKVKLIKNSDQTEVIGILKHYIVNNRSVVNLFVTVPLATNEDYTIRLEPGLEDVFGNAITTLFTAGFTTGMDEFTLVSTIDNFESGISNWWQPQQSGSTSGILTELTGTSSATNNFNYIHGGARSMKLTYGWDTNATSGWLIRVYRPATTPTFTSSYILQTYLFGDGTGNKFRFAVRDATNGIEASQWYTMDWVGWKLINWDMANDPVVAWVGNGILEDPLRIDSYQITFEPGNENTGELYFDDLRVVNKTTVGVDDEEISGIPSDYILEQNYPNPFNPSTQIRFGIPQSGLVKLDIYNLLGQKITTLINEEMSSGYHSVDFNAGDISSGIYVYSLSVNDFVTSKKMVLLK
jgi:N-acetylmuramoyl-L-alanine amidase